jgi:hypothetical protein
MTAITQRIPNFLGGVSQQTDDQKFPGQVRDLINGYPEPTFGLLKRPGGKFVAELKTTGNTLVAPTTLNGAKLFTIFRDDTEQYLVAIIGGKTPTTNNEIKVWKLSDGSPVTVNYGTNAKNYLSGTKDRYEVLTVNDFTFITNKEKVVTARAQPTYTEGTKATIRILAIEYSAQYKVVINGLTASVVTRNSDTPGTTPTRILNYENILDDLKAAIDALAVAGLTVTKLGNTLELSRTSAFTINGIGGKGGDALSVFQDTVENIARLPNRASNGRVVRIANTGGTQDDYYVTFVVDGSGNGYWEETRSPSVSPGLDAATMPHELVREANGSFTFRQVTWEDRLVGDQDTSPNPSFVGETIQQLFFYNNRLGFLTTENVVMSQAGDYFNLFVASATTSSAADPIDISCSSIRPAVLYAVIPVAQGLVLFSRGQQFLVTSDSGVLAPTTVNIKTISNYEMDPQNKPVDLGTTISFISKITSYTRVFEMETRGSDDSPIVVDISRLVPEWIPSSVDQVVSSPQNSLLSLGYSGSRFLYLFRFYTTGEKRELQSWFKWKLSGNVLHHAIYEDTMWAVTRQEDSVVLQRIDLIQSPEASTIQTKDGLTVDPRLDIWKLNPTRSYNSTTKISKVYLPCSHDSTLSPCIVSGQPITQGSTFLDIGLILLPSSVSTDAGGDYIEVADQDLTDDNVIVGYLYDMEVQLPQIYVRSGEGKQISDFTGSLVVSRLKFNVGLGGDFKFLVDAKGRGAWEEAFAVTDANYYAANDVPLAGSKSYTIPLHQKSQNMSIKLKASGPFPVSLLSLMWEGHYSTRYYTRR